MKNLGVLQHVSLLDKTLLQISIQDILLYHSLRIEEGGIEGYAMLHDTRPPFSLSVIGGEDDVLQFVVDLLHFALIAFLLRRP